MCMSAVKTSVHRVQCGQILEVAIEEFRQNWPLNRDHNTLLLQEASPMFPVSKGRYEAKNILGGWSYYLHQGGYVYHLQVCLFVFFKQDYTNSTGQFSWKLYQRWIFQSSRALELWVNQPHYLYQMVKLWWEVNYILEPLQLYIFTNQNSRHSWGPMRLVNITLTLGRRHFCRGIYMLEGTFSLSGDLWSWIVL